MIRRVWVVLRFKDGLVDFSTFDSLESAFGYKRVMEEVYDDCRVIVLEGCTFDDVKSTVDNPDGAIEVEGFKDLLPILRKGGKIVIGFYADWCDDLVEILDELAKEIEDFTFVKVDLSKAAEIAYIFGINSVPTILLISMKTTSEISKDFLKEFID